MIAALLAAPVALEGQSTGLCSDDEKRQWLRFQIEPLMLSADSRRP
jgi:hypothetical protein